MKMNFRQRLLSSTLIVAAAALCSPAYAQPADDDQPETPVQANIDPDAQDGEGTDSIIVTGSRIRRRDLESTSPLTVVQDEEFQLSGATNVEQVINTLPQVLPGVTGFSNNPGNGAVTLNLRNLGATRTLVLVNGRRFMFFDTSQVVDLNTIPQFLIESVDVVTGGASAVYGSDAVAGVVNFRLRDDLEGVHLGAQYSITEEGDGPRRSLDLAIGAPFADRRGNVTAFANYTKRGAVFQGDRTFSTFAAADACIRPGTTNRFGVGTNLGGSLATCVARGGEVGLVAGGSSLGTSALEFNTGRLFDPTGGGTTAFRDPEDTFNYAPLNFLQLPQERYLMGGYGSYEISPGIRPFAEISFANNQVAQELAPTPIAQAVQVPIDSPFFSDETRQRFRNAGLVDANGIANLFVGRRFVESGQRNAEANRDAFRILAGVQGDLGSSFIEDLRYETFYSYARTRNTQRQEGNIVRSRFAAALNTEVVNGQLRCRDAAARAQGCVPLNIFGAGTASPQAVDFVTVGSTNTDISELKNAQASMSGSLGNFGLGAPNIGAAIGVEYREVGSQFIPDEFLSSGDVAGFNAGTPTSGEYDVKEVFGELRLPILGDRFVHRFEVNGAARYSDYSLENVGGVYTYAVGAELAPIRDITFRGQYQRAVRAPNVEELFGGSATGFPGAQDPCSDRGPAQTRTEALRQLCIAAGVPANRVFTRAVQPNAQIEATFGGNPDLEEETSDTYTAGVIFRPRFIPRLNVSVDYFNIKVDDVIGTAGGGLNSALSLCFLVAQDLNDPVCQIANGTPGNRTRGPTGAISQGAQRNPVLLAANEANLSTSGIDAQIDYSTPVPFSFMGRNEARLSFFFLGTWLDKYRSTAVEEFPERTLRCEGSICGNPLPEFRTTSRLTMSDGPATISVRHRYMSEIEDPRIDNTFIGRERIDQDRALFPNARIDDVHYFDLTFGFDVNDNFTLTTGVNNLFDKKPEILGTVQEQANTFPGTFDVLGRDFFVSGRLRF